MGRLYIVAVECNYQEVDRQLKEWFIHGLNDKCILEELIKELMATKNYDHITSGGMLAWAKRVEVQRAQAAVLNSLTEAKQFDKIKVSDKIKDNKARASVNQATQWQPCRYCGGVHQPRQCPAYERCVQSVERWGTSGRSATVEWSRMVNDMEQEASQEYREDEIEMVSINFVYMNKIGQC